MFASAYGIVHRARAPSSEVVALKQLRIDPSDRGNGIPLTALRELSVLRSLKHPNIVNVLDIAVEDKNGEDAWDELFMVMEYAEQVGTSAV